MRICLIASSRHPIREPFAGGLESSMHALATELCRRGHDVDLFAGPGSDPRLPVRALTRAPFDASPAARADRNAPSDRWMAEHHAYLALVLDLASGASGAYDVVHNNSLHHLPVAMAPLLPAPLITTLHTPPLPWLESAVALAPGCSTFTAVSAHTARAWAHVVPSVVVPNGVGLERWRFGAGGGPAVWSGRLVPEKAPHEAIDACRLAGVPLVLTGPRHEERYFREQVEPRLGDGIEYAGHLDHEQLSRLVASSSVAVVTPQWDEPYGLVAAEAMACGTPVAAFDRGALREVVGAAGRVVPAGDVAALAAAVVAAAGLDRRAVRRHAEDTCSLRRMVDDYEQVYAQAMEVGRAA